MKSLQITKKNFKEVGFTVIPQHGNWKIDIPNPVAKTIEPIKVAIMEVIIGYQLQNKSISAGRKVLDLPSDICKKYNFGGGSVSVEFFPSLQKIVVLSTVTANQVFRF